MTTKEQFLRDKYTITDYLVEQDEEEINEPTERLSKEEKATKKAQLIERKVQRLLRCVGNLQNDTNTQRKVIKFMDHDNKLAFVALKQSTFESFIGKEIAAAFDNPKHEKLLFDDSILTHRVVPAPAPPPPSPEDIELAREFITFYLNSVQNPKELKEELESQAIHISEPTTQIEKLFVHLFREELKPFYEFFIDAIASLYKPREVLHVPKYDSEDKKHPIMKPGDDHDQIRLLDFREITASGFYNIINFPPWEISDDTCFPNSLLSIGTTNRGMYFTISKREKMGKHMTLIQFKDDCDMEELENLQSKIQLKSFGPALRQVLTEPEEEWRRAKLQSTDVQHILSTLKQEFVEAWEFILALELEAKTKNEWHKDGRGTFAKVLINKSPDYIITPEGFERLFKTLGWKTSEIDRMKVLLRWLGFEDVAGGLNKMKVKQTNLSRLKRMAKKWREEPDDEEETEEEKEEKKPDKQPAPEPETEEEEEEKEEEKQPEPTLPPIRIHFSRKKKLDKEPAPEPETEPEEETEDEKDD